MQSCFAFRFEMTNSTLFCLHCTKFSLTPNYKNLWRDKMNEFPRTVVGGVSVSRMIIGTNWFLGWSHTSAAKDQFIKTYHNRQSIADVMEVFFKHGIDTIMAPLHPLLREALDETEQRTGRKGCTQRASCCHSALIHCRRKRSLPGGRIFLKSCSPCCRHRSLCSPGTSP